MRTTISLASKPYPGFTFRHKFSLLVVDPTQSGKPHFVQQVLKHNRIVYEEQKIIRIFWYYNQFLRSSYEDLKNSLGKSIRSENGMPELSENLCEINPRTITPPSWTIWWLKRQTLWYMLIVFPGPQNMFLQNMFSTGKYDPDISREAQHLVSSEVLR